MPKRAPRRATRAQAAPDFKALDQLVDLSAAESKHSERLAEDGGKAAKASGSARSRRAKAAAGRGTPEAAAPGADSAGASGPAPDLAAAVAAALTADQPKGRPSRSRRAGAPAGQPAAGQFAVGQFALDKASAPDTAPAMSQTPAADQAPARDSAPEPDQARAADQAPSRAARSRRAKAAAQPAGGEALEPGADRGLAAAVAAALTPGQPEKPASRSRRAKAPAGQPAPAAEAGPDAHPAAAEPAVQPSRSRRAKAPAGTPEPNQASAATAAATPVVAKAGSSRSRRAKAGTAADSPPPADQADPQTAAGEPPAPVGGRPPMAALLFQAPVLSPSPTRRRAAEPDEDLAADELADAGAAAPPSAGKAGETAGRARSTGRGGRGRGAAKAGSGLGEAETGDERTASGTGGKSARGPKAEPAGGAEGAGQGEPAEAAEEGEESGSRRRRRRTRTGRKGEAGGESAGEGVTALAGSTRLEAKRQRRKEGRETGRRRIQITEAEFLARRESVERRMVVRERDGRTQIAVLEDGVLVEHYVARRTQHSMVGNVYLGRVQNVLPSMEAAFVDIGRGRNAVLYAGEVNWDAAGLEGQPRRIEQALSSGDAVMVQVTKDPIGHKGSRLTSQITLAGRYLVFVPDGSMTGISRKLPEAERQRLKKLLKEIVPDGSGVIVRTAAEGASDAELRADVERLAAAWAKIQQKAATAQAPALLKGEPDLAIRVVRDIFNADFTSLTVSGPQAWDDISGYLQEVAPELCDRVERWTSDQDVFAADRIDEQLAKGMDRKVWLPSGGSLVIDRTEAMSVIDVNTGKFTGAGGTLEETVTRNNLEAAEEIVRQLRLRDIGGIIVIDFIDMVLESNRDLVLRRLVEALARDRTRHQVAEVTSLGLVQMTRKRVGQGLVEAFSETCEACGGRGFIVHADPVERSHGGSGSGSGGSGGSSADGGDGGSKRKKRGGKKHRKKGADAAGSDRSDARGNGGGPSGDGNGALVLAQTPPEAKATLASIAAAAAASRETAATKAQAKTPDADADPTAA